MEHGPTRWIGRSTEWITTISGITFLQSTRGVSRALRESSCRSMPLKNFRCRRGNSIHGSAHYYNRNEAFAAASPFYVPTDITPKAPRLRNENVGGSVGGPILKNKFFYYAAF